MDRSRHLVCPILVGRDDLLDLAARRIREADRDGGRFLLLAGEAGVGKTRLLGAIERLATAAGFRSIRGGAYPSDLQVPGAILLDLARAMLRTDDLHDLGARLSARLADDIVSAGRDPGQRRRLLVLDVADLLAHVPAVHPTTIALEDLHWSDDLTLEILEALARRVPERPVLLIGTYRSDELYPRVPMRGWRARLVGRRQAEELRIRRLTEADTATMTTLLLGSGLPAGRDVATAVHARTDGIPLHVEELLGALAPDGTVDAEAIRDLGVPETVEDAILARLAQRSDDAADLARAGAVIGRSFELDLLAEVTDRDPAELGPALGELADHFILLPTPSGGRYGFRHALIGDAIYAHIPEPERRRLHDRTATAAARRPDIGTGAFLALHYERAGRSEEAHAAARTAAEAATAISAHTEARELFALALRTAPRDLPPVGHGRLLEAYATSAAATDDNTAAAEAFAAAREAYLEGGDILAAAAIVGPLVAVHHLLGEGLEARAERLRAALGELPSGPPLHGPSADPAVDGVRARLLAAMSAAYMLDRRLDESIAYATEARRLAELVEDRATAQDAATTLGTCLVFAGRMDDGWVALEAAIDDAHAMRNEAQAARALRMIGSSASVLVEYERAEHWLRAGIDEAERHELWNHRHYMASHLAHVAWATGRWPEADTLARRALADGRGGITTRVTALHVLGYVALGQGRLPEATDALEEARALGARMRELQRISPALWGLAEIALARDDPGTAIDLVEEGRAASALVGDAAYLFPLLVTGTRAYLAGVDPAAARRWVEVAGGPLRARAIPGTIPAIDHAAGLVALAEGATGRARAALEAAGAGWAARGRAWEGAWAKVDLARMHLRANRHAECVRQAELAMDAAARLGAPAIGAAADAVRHAAARGGEPDPWAPLTAREFEIAGLIAAGRTNPAIAEELGIARKTVTAHVEHILTKLDVGRRAEVAAWVAARPGLTPVLHSRPHGNDREE